MDVCVNQFKTRQFGDCCNDKMEEGYIYHDEWSDNEIEKHDTHTSLVEAKLILQLGLLLQLVCMFQGHQ